MSGLPIRKLLFVCTGNICRSPLAQAVFDQQAKNADLSRHFVTESAGTHPYHVGSNADQRIRKVAEAHGLRFNHQSRQVKTQDIQFYDYILAMGSDHQQYLQNMAKTDHERQKIILYRQFDPLVGDSSFIPDVPDPYYGDQTDFVLVYEIVDRTTQALLAWFQTQAPTTTK